jgi:hypothetical protein
VPSKTYPSDVTICSPLPPTTLPSASEVPPASVPLCHFKVMVLASST